MLYLKFIENGGATTATTVTDFAALTNQITGFAVHTTTYTYIIVIIKAYIFYTSIPNCF
jgi:hypothetical protein